MIALTFDEQKTFYLDSLRNLGVADTDIKIIGPGDIACKCPICGDSRYGNKKRLHLYQKGSVINVNCFNGDCPVKNLTCWSFLKTYEPKTFNQLKSYVSTRYLRELGGGFKSGFNDNKKTLEILGADDVGLDLDYSNNEKLDNQKLLNFIKKFNPSTDWEDDLKTIMSFFKLNADQLVHLRNI